MTTAWMGKAEDHNPTTDRWYISTMATLAGTHQSRAQIQEKVTLGISGNPIHKGSHLLHLVSFLWVHSLCQTLLDWQGCRGQGLILASGNTEIRGFMQEVHKWLGKILKINPKKLSTLQIKMLISHTQQLLFSLLMH